jgi:hypothetical protein
MARATKKEIERRRAQAAALIAACRPDAPPTHRAFAARLGVSVSTFQTAVHLADVVAALRDLRERARAPAGEARPAAR